MTNKQYFIHLQSHPVTLGEFEVFAWELYTNFIPNAVRYVSWCIEVKCNGAFLPFRIHVHLTRRSILTSIDYTVPHLCKISPYELREWCPAIFLPYTNYLHWQKFLRIALEIYMESNPKILENVCK